MSRIFGIWNVEKTGRVLQNALQKLNGQEYQPLAFTPQESNFPHSQFRPEATYTNAIAICGSENLYHNKIIVAFDGYIFNAHALLRKYNLTAPAGDIPETIAQLYQTIGTKLFEELDGAWAMAIFDENKLILARDRFGIKPLLYCVDRDGVAFSSTATTLMALETVKPKWSEEKFLQFVVYGATHNPNETFFENIEALKPGHFITWSVNEKPNQNQYYNLRKNIVAHAHPDITFETLFRESITKNLNARNVGALLSGGLDSSLIVSEMLKIKGEGFQTFTCSFPDTAIDESKYAGMLAKDNPALHQHFTTPQAIDFYNHFDELIGIHERPIGSASIFAQWWTMKFAAENGVKIIFDGQGADEIFGGYYPFAGAYLISLLKLGDFTRFQSELKALQQKFNPQMFRAMLRSAFYLLPQQLQFLARKQNRLGFGLISKKYKSRAAALTAPPRGSSDFLELSLRSVEFGLYELLQYADKNAAAHQLDNRMPFVDHRIVELAIGLDVNQKINDGWTKLPIRKLLAANGFETLAWRKDKLGFVAPQDRWRAEVGDLFFEKIKSAPIPDILDLKSIKALFKNAAYSASGQTEFWRVLALLRWLEVFEVEVV